MRKSNAVILLLYSQNRKEGISLSMYKNTVHACCATVDSIFVKSCYPIFIFQQQQKFTQPIIAKDLAYQKNTFDINIES